ncbi:MAG: CotH kinase family protein, partial [bacterium]
TLSVKASKMLSGNKYLALIDGMLNPFRNRHILLNSGLPIYDLKIKHREYAKIEQAVEAAKKQGWMDDDLKVWARAKFIVNGEVYNVKVRVRGDLPNHWRGPKKSWRIKFSKEKVTEADGTVRDEPRMFENTRQMNLIIPIDRRYTLSYFVNQLMREQGLLVARDDFVILRINGTIAGLYYKVEHFDKPLLAMQRRPETTIFGQDDRAMHFEQYTKLGTAVASDARFDLGATRRLIVPNDGLAMRAMQVLFDHARNPTPENFRRARAVLDWKKYMSFRNLTTIFNTNHVRFGGDNLRLYFDPSRGLLEPVPWDLHVVKMPPEPGTIDFWNQNGPDELQRATLQDPLLRLERNKMIWEMVGDGGDSLIAKYRKIHEKFRPTAWADVLATPIHGHKMDVMKKEIEYNIRRTYKVLNTSNGSLVYRLEANPVGYQSNGASDLASIELATFNFSGIDFHEMTISDSLLLAGDYQLYEDTNGNGIFDASDSLLQEVAAQDWPPTGSGVRLPLKLFLPPEVEYGGADIHGRYWEFMDTRVGRRTFFLRGKLTPEKRHPLEWFAPRISVIASNAVTGKSIPSGFNGDKGIDPANSIGITAYDASDPFDLEAIDLTLTDFLQRHPQFKASAAHPGAAEISGEVTITETVIVPKGVPLILQPGADITMQPGVSVVSYGGLQAIGTPEQRISIHDDGSGDPWGTFAVVRPVGQATYGVRPSKKVVMHYLDVQGGGQAQVNATLFTGGLAVYESDVDMAFCRIMDMRSEDGFNLKNGRISMRNTLFDGTDSDAVDLDFCTGEVVNCTFINSKGDGLDISGSSILATGCRFENIVDKGTSVGENSHPILVNNLYINCDIGVSCKDLSRPKVAHSTFVDNRLAIEAKRKKPMFGPGGGVFVNCVFAGNEILVSEDYFSKNNVSVSHSLVDLENSYVTCKKAEIRFEDGSYLIQSGVYEGNGYRMATPDWAQSVVGTFSRVAPGVLSGFSK